MNIVVVAYLFHENKVLLIKHKKSGLWLPVGGHVEVNEGFDAALRREIEEEVNLTNIEFILPKKCYEDSDERRRAPLPFFVQETMDDMTFEFVGMVKNIDNLKIQVEELEEAC
jgi:ADP-ribose pyrophosphatase YjhB (NUDIX family)